MRQERWDRSMALPRHCRRALPNDHHRSQMMQNAARMMSVASRQVRKSHARLTYTDRLSQIARSCNDQRTRACKSWFCVRALNRKSRMRSDSNGVSPTMRLVKLRFTKMDLRPVTGSARFTHQDTLRVRGNQESLTCAHDGVNRLQVLVRIEWRTALPLEQTTAVALDLFNERTAAVHSLKCLQVRCKGR